MPYLGPDGNNLPDGYRVDGIAWIDYIGFQSRVNTVPGTQLRRPDYGVDLSGFLDKNLSLASLEEQVRQGLAGLTVPEFIIVDFISGEMTIQVVTG